MRVVAADGASWPSQRSKRPAQPGAPGGNQPRAGPAHTPCNDERVAPNGNQPGGLTVWTRSRPVARFARDSACTAHLAARPSATAVARAPSLCVPTADGAHSGRCPHAVRGANSPQEAGQCTAVWTIVAVQKQHPQHERAAEAGSLHACTVADTQWPFAAFVEPGPSRLAAGSWSRKPRASV